MNQPKRSLANTVLEDGADLSDVEGGLEFYAPPVSWSTPLLWGATRIILDDPLDVETKNVFKTVWNDGSISGETGSGVLAWRRFRCPAVGRALRFRKRRSDPECVPTLERGNERNENWKD